MIVLQASYMKSGSYFLWKILDTTFRVANLERRSNISQNPISNFAKKYWLQSFAEQADIDFITWKCQGNQSTYYENILPNYRRRIDDLDDYLERTTHLWTHEPFNTLSTPNILHKIDKTILIIRDPRDCALSFIDFAKQSFYQREYHSTTYTTDSFCKLLPTILNQWTEMNAGWLANAEEHNIYYVTFESLATAFDEEYGRLLKYLEIELSADKVAEVKESVDIRNMKDTSPMHVRTGSCFRWTEQPDQERISRIVRDKAPFLRLLNYPVTVEEKDKIGEKGETIRFPEQLTKKKVNNSLTECKLV